MTIGEVLTTPAMKSIGDLDEIRAQSGLKGAIRALVTCPLFVAGVGFLALVTNAIAGKLFLKENGDHFIELRLDPIWGPRRVQGFALADDKEV